MVCDKETEEIHILEANLGIGDRKNTERLQVRRQPIKVDVEFDSIPILSMPPLRILNRERHGLVVVHLLRERRQIIVLVPNVDSREGRLSENCRHQAIEQFAE